MTHDPLGWRNDGVCGLCARYGLFAKPARPFPPHLAPACRRPCAGAEIAPADRATLGVHEGPGCLGCLDAREVGARNAP